MPAPYQDEGPGPIVEREILMDATTTSYTAAWQVMGNCARFMKPSGFNGVFLEGTLLQGLMDPSPAPDCTERPSSEQVADCQPAHPQSASVAPPWPAIVLSADWARRRPVSYLPPSMPGRCLRPLAPGRSPTGRALQHLMPQQVKATIWRAGQAALLGRARATAPAARGVYVPRLGNPQIDCRLASLWRLSY